MQTQNIKLFWRLVYVACSLIYMAWVVQLSFNNFEMVHSHYQRAGERLQPQRIQTIARNELVRQCREETMGADLLRGGEDPCLSLPRAVLEERQKEVKERLVSQWGLAWRKLVLFYLSFGIIFLILPPLILYLFLSLFIWFLKNLKFIK